jgi:DNA-binding transcriptional LysR family regulator
MHAFVAVVRNGSLSAAEGALGISKATLSRKLADLERTLGTALLHRTPHAQSLTPAGQMLYERVAPLLAEAERAATDIRATSKEPMGLVRVAAALGFGQTVLMPILARFLAEVPNVRVDLALSDDPVRLVGRGFDLAIRTGPLDPGDLVSLRIAQIDQSIVASPSYIAAHGTPRSVPELAAHVILVREPHHETWRFEGEKGPRDVGVGWRVSTGAMTSLVEGARLGMGLAMVPTYMAEPCLGTGELVAIELGETPACNYATALFPRSPTPPAAVRALLNHIATDLSRNPVFAPRRAPLEPKMNLDAVRERLVALGREAARLQDERIGDEATNEAKT